MIDILETAKIDIPLKVKEADILTQFAVETRYPSLVEEVTKQEYKEVVTVAAYVVFWAEKALEKK